MNKKKKGFTIVELVVVIAVIGILSAILIPTFAGLIERSKKQGQQLELRNAYEAYAIEAGENVLTEHEVVLSKEGGYNDKVATGEGAADLKELWKLDDKGEWVNVEAEDFTIATVAQKLALVEVTGHNAADPYNGYFVYKFVKAAE